MKNSVNAKLCSRAECQNFVQVLLDVMTNARVAAGHVVELSIF